MISYFSCTDVFSFPSERIAHSIMESNPAGFFVYYQITHLLPGISFGKYVCQQLLIRCFWVVEVLGEECSTLHSPNHFSRFSNLCSDAKSGLWISIRLFGLGIHPNDESIGLHIPPQWSCKTNLPSSPWSTRDVVKLGQP